jgi:hypothetical protein
MKNTIPNQTNLTPTQTAQIQATARRLGISRAEAIKQALILAGYIDFEPKAKGAPRGKSIAEQSKSAEWAE